MRALIAVAALAACHHPSAPPPPPVGNAGGAAAAHELLASLTRTECYGWCPAYTVRIYQDGVVEYQGDAFVVTQGKATGHVGPDALAAIDKLFEDADWFALADAYTHEDWTDNPSASASWTHDGKTKTIEHYYGDTHAPAVLETVEDGIDQIVHVEQWIGTEDQRQKLGNTY